MCSKDTLWVNAVIAIVFGVILLVASTVFLACSLRIGTHGQYEVVERCRKLIHYKRPPLFPAITEHDRDIMCEEYNMLLATAWIGFVISLLQTLASTFIAVFLAYHICRVIWLPLHMFFFLMCIVALTLICVAIVERDDIFCKFTQKTKSPYPLYKIVPDLLEEKCEGFHFVKTIGFNYYKQMKFHEKNTTEKDLNEDDIKYYRILAFGCMVFFLIALCLNIIVLFIVVLVVFICTFKIPH